jgi:uncharacterized protein (TIGR02246 family)
MRMIGALLILVLGAVGNAYADSSSAATTPAAELAAFKQAIRQLYDTKEKAWAAGDAETIVTKFYSVDAVSAGEGDPATTIGRAEFRKAYQQFVKDVTSVRIESVKSVVNGNAGWDWANFYHTPKPDKAKDYPPSPIRILFLFSKEHGQWVCKGEMYVNGKFPRPLPSSNGKP